MSRIKYIAEFEKGLEHCFKVDPWLREAMRSQTFPSYSVDSMNKELNAFESLSKAIMGQQVSGAAARSICNKFLALFGTGPLVQPISSSDESSNDVGAPRKASVEMEESYEFPSSRMVAEMDFERLRAAGLSGQKAKYIYELAKAFEEKFISNEMLLQGTDEEVTELLVSQKGIGPWSAEMFLMFQLKRMDIFAMGDLGIQRGIANYIRLSPTLSKELKGAKCSERPVKHPKIKKLKATSQTWRMPTVQEIEYISEKFQPYRSVLMNFLWRLSDTDIGIVTGEQKQAKLSVKSETTKVVTTSPSKKMSNLQLESPSKRRKKGDDAKNLMMKEQELTEKLLDPVVPLTIVQNGTSSMMTSEKIVEADVTTTTSKVIRRSKRIAVTVSKKM